MLKLVDLFQQHPAAISGSLVSTISTLGITTGAVPVPPGAPMWLPYLLSVCGPMLMFVAHRLLAARAAKKRALAASKSARALALRADSDPRNDAEANALEDSAAELVAEAAALDAFGSGK